MVLHLKTKEIVPGFLQITQHKPRSEYKRINSRGIHQTIMKKLNLHMILILAKHDKDFEELKWLLHFHFIMS
jgi:hypothetical protein